MEPYRFGLSVIPETNPDRVIDLCIVAERLGFDFIWMADEGPEFYDPFIILSQVASKTKNIKLATGITNPYMRHPSLIASAIMTLNSISHGRAVLGIGAGGSLALPKLGLPMWNKPVDTLKITITTLREIFAAKEVTATSDVWKIENLKWTGPPADIPIYVGAKGPRMIQVASQMADGLILSTLPTRQLNRLVGLVKSKTGSGFDLAYISRVCIAQDEIAARKLVKRYLTFSVADCHRETLDYIGMNEQDQETVRERLALEGQDSAAELISDDTVDSLAVAGTADRCVEAVKERFATGINHFIVSPPYGPDPEKGLSLFAREIIGPMKRS
jgi:5,10-methylenetetrahydromethanopterin reductase